MNPYAFFHTLCDRRYATRNKKKWNVVNILVPLQCQPATQLESPPTPDYNADMIGVKEILGLSYCRGPGIPEQANNCNAEKKSNKGKRK